MRADGGSQTPVMLKPGHLAKSLLLLLLEKPSPSSRDASLRHGGQEDCGREGTVHGRSLTLRHSN